MCVQTFTIINIYLPHVHSGFFSATSNQHQFFSLGQMRSLASKCVKKCASEMDLNFFEKFTTYSWSKVDVHCSECLFYSNNDQISKLIRDFLKNLGQCALCVKHPTHALVRHKHNVKYARTLV